MSLAVEQRVGEIGQRGESFHPPVFPKFAVIYHGHHDAGGHSEDFDIGPEKRQHITRLTSVLHQRIDKIKQP